MTILIVDDQPHVIAGIIDGVNWARCGITKLYKALSAESARKLIKKHEIDVLLCDIEMPKEDGLQLIAWLRDIGYETECILLTAHASFNYAQQALRLGSFDYIVQPAPYERIEESIISAVKKARQADEDKRLSSYGQLLSGKQDQLIKVLLMDWFSGGARDIEQLLTELDGLGEPVMRARGFLPALVRFDDGLNPASINILLESALSDALHGTGYGALILQSGTFTFQLALYEQESGAASESEIAPRLLGLGSILAGSYDCPARIAACTSLVRAEAVPDALAELLRQKPQEPAQSGPEANESASEQIDTILRYIADNIEKDIRRLDVASAVYLSENYLSRLFKEHMHISLKEFIIQEKMKLAKTLISGTHLPISVIASKVGYTNFSHFSQSYKKQWGVSPSQEREQ